MDHHRFDNLTRALARRSSRRTMLSGLAGAIAAGLTGARSHNDAVAQRAARLANGAACTSSGQCTSFTCIDGVCCDSACTGQCESCATGACLPVSGAPAGNRPACSGSGACAATCDGVTRTHCAGYPGAETACSGATCADGRQTTYACGGNGSCVPTTTNCGRFGCDALGTACATGCDSDAECDDGDACTVDACVGGACVHTSLLCEGGDACAVASCDAVFGCVVTSVDDGLPGGCAAGTVCCDGSCTALGTDEHCGFCGDACVGTGVACGAEMPGVCGCLNDGLACGDAVCGTATNNCGETVACGPAGGACPFNQTCAGGSCGCPSGYEELNEGCFRTDTRSGNCGGCAHGIFGSALGASAEVICANAFNRCDAGSCPAGQICYLDIDYCLFPC